MTFGLAIGLSVAFAVYVKDREPAVTVERDYRRFKAWNAMVMKLAEDSRQK